MKLKPIADQLLVTTGATSSTRLIPAGMSAKKNENLILISRNARCANRWRKSTQQAITCQQTYLHLLAVGALAADYKHKQSINDH